MYVKLYVYLPWTMCDFVCSQGVYVIFVCEMLLKPSNATTHTNTNTHLMIDIMNCRTRFLNLEPKKQKKSFSWKRVTENCAGSEFSGTNSRETKLKIKNPTRKTAKLVKLEINYTIMNDTEVPKFFEWNKHFQ
jgi:CDP-diacylglycerol pyrophosphatase